MDNNNIQFDNDQHQVQPGSGSGSAGPKGLSALLIKNGLAKDQAGANKVLIVTLIIVVILIILVNY